MLYVYPLLIALPGGAAASDTDPFLLVDSKQPAEATEDGLGLTLAERTIREHQGAYGDTTRHTIYFCDWASSGGRWPSTRAPATACRAR